MVEEIKRLCKENGTSIKSLERELGFGNGTIRRWDDSRPSFDKIQKVADYFGCSIYDLTGEEKETQATEVLKTLLADFGALSTEFEEIQTLQALLLNSTIDQIKEALTGLDTGKKFDLAMFLLNDVKGNEDK